MEKLITACEGFGVDKNKFVYGIYVEDVIKWVNESPKMGKLRAIHPTLYAEVSVVVKEQGKNEEVVPLYGSATFEEQVGLNDSPLLVITDKPW